MGNEINMIEQMYSSIPEEILIPALVVTILGCLFDALLGFRFLKLIIVLSAFSFGYNFGSVELALLLGDVGGFGETLALILGLVCAILFALVSLKVYKALVYFAGGAIGFILGLIVPLVVFRMFDLATVGAIVGVILAIVLTVPSAKLFFNKLYKPFYIIFSSLGGMMGAAMCFAMIFTFDIYVLALSMLVGMLLGIPAAICQFKLNKDVTLADRIESK